MKRQIDDRTYLNYLLQSLNVNDLKHLCRDFEIKGFSKLKKLELIDSILDSLAKEEYEELLKQKELEIISSEINLAIKKIKGEDRESLIEVKVVNPDEHEIELFFKGWNWENTSFLSITPNNINNPERDCDCRIGSNMGFCSHFWVGFIFSLKQNYFKLKDWTLTILPEDFEKKIGTIVLTSKLATEKGAEGAETISLVEEGSEDYQYSEYIDKSITIYEGEITKLEKKQQEFQGNITTYYLLTLKDVKIGPRVEKKSDFKEEEITIVDSINLRISERLHDENDLKIGDKLGANGKLTKDNFLKMYIVKNIRKIQKV